MLTRTLTLVPPHVGDVAFVVEVEHLTIVVKGSWLYTAAAVSEILGKGCHKSLTNFL